MAWADEPGDGRNPTSLMVRRASPGVNKRCLPDGRVGRAVLGLIDAPVAQLDRAAASEAVGQKFESSRVHHLPYLNFPLTRRLCTRSPGLAGS